MNWTTSTYAPETTEYDEYELNTMAIMIIRLLVDGF